MSKGFRIEGDIKDVTKTLNEERERRKGVKVIEYVRELNAMRAEAKQFGMSLEDYRRTVYGKKG